METSTPRQRCCVCGRALSLHEAVRGGHCSRPDCQRGAVKQQIKRQRDVAAAVLAQRVEEVRSAVVAALGLETATVVGALVPASTRPIVKLPRNRKIEFRRHLARLVADSFREDPDATARPLADDETRHAHQFGAETRAAQDGCATCRGHCCRLGAGNYAFLDADTLLRYRTLRPQLRAREVVAAYVQRIPDASTAGSCVFHGASGCTLPREMRAAICNVYHCPGLERLQEMIEDPAARAVVIVAAAEDTTVVRWTVHRHSGESRALEG